MQTASVAFRRSEFDVTNQIDTTDAPAVEGEVVRIYRELYPGAAADPMSRAFADCARLYKGGDARYHPCDTEYHNIQHVLDVTLAMARLMDGYERGSLRREPLGARMFALGIVCALFHDVGYLRHRKDTRRNNGAEYTMRHVSRGARYLDQYVAQIGVPDWSGVAGQLLHFTGYEIPAERIELRARAQRYLGNMLGSADILAQMADRCYLEKCRDRLYPEFVSAGLASGQDPVSRKPTALFESADHLLSNTPAFYRKATLRLVDQLGAAYRYMEVHFNGPNYYVDEVSKNIRYAERIAEASTLAALRRVPPLGTRTDSKSWITRESPGVLPPKSELAHPLVTGMLGMVRS
jgi:hypothetical protein